MSIRRLQCALAACALAVASAASATAGAAAPSLTDEEARGQSIYRTGASARRHPVVAQVAGGTRVPGTAASCAGCHGADGSGRREGGVLAPDIRWPSLTQAGTRELAAGRSRGPYDEALLLRAITRGIDSAGQPLLAAMPRFELYDDDARALVAYLKRLHTLRDPGIEEGVVRIGAVLPLSGSAAEQGRALRALLEDRLASLGAGAGVHGRTVQLEVEDAEGADAPRRVGALAERAFALATPYAPPLQGAIAEAARAGMPVISPVAGWEARDLEPLFSSLPGRTHVLGALAAFWSQLPVAERGALTVVLGSRPDAARVKDALEASLPSASKVAYVNAQQWAEASASSGWVLLDTEPGLLQRAASRLAGARVLAASTSVAGQPGELLASAERIVVAAPVLPPREEGAVREADAWLASKGLAPLPPVVTIQALRGIAIIGEALRASGRELSREKFVAAIESVRSLPTPGGPVTFGPRQRNGARGAALFAMEPSSGRLTLLREWQESP